VNLYTRLDDYGSCNPMFRVGDRPGEFSPKHWLNSIDHNSIVFLSNELIEKINATLVPADRGYKCSITFGGQTYTVSTRIPKINVNDITYCGFSYDDECKYFIQ